MKAETGTGKVPLDLQDILGYIAPGAALLSWILLFEIWASSRSYDLGISTPITTLLQLAQGRLFTSEWGLAVVGSLALLLILYLLGHVLAAIGSFLIDRTLVYKGYGYPFQTILGIDLPNRWQSGSRQFYRAVFFWLNLGLVSLYVHLYLLPYLHGWGVIAAPFLAVLSWWMVILAVGLKVAARLLTKSRDRLQRVRLLPITAAQGSCPVLLAESPLTDMPRSIKEGAQRISAELSFPYLSGWKRKGFNSLHLFIWLLAAPYNYLSWILHGYFNTRSPFDATFARMYRNQFNSRFSPLKAETSGTHNYWLPYIHLATQSPKAWLQAEHWRTLSLFSRNLSVGLYLAFLYSFLLLASSTFPEGLRGGIAYLPHFHQNTGFLILSPLIVFALSQLFLVRYYYFYYSYFSKAVFRSFVWCEAVRPVPSTPVPDVDAA